MITDSRDLGSEDSLFACPGPLVDNGTGTGLINSFLLSTCYVALLFELLPVLLLSLSVHGSKIVLPCTYRTLGEYLPGEKSVRFGFSLVFGRKINMALDNQVLVHYSISLSKHWCVFGEDCLGGLFILPRDFFTRIECKCVHYFEDPLLNEIFLAERRVSYKFVKRNMR